MSSSLVGAEAAQPAAPSLWDEGAEYMGGIPAHLHDQREVLRGHLAALEGIRGGMLQQLGGTIPPDPEALSCYENRAANLMTVSTSEDAYVPKYKTGRAEEGICRIPDGEWLSLTVPPRMQAATDEEPDILFAANRVLDLHAVPIDQAAYRRYESKVRAMESEYGGRRGGDERCHHSDGGPLPPSGPSHPSDHLRLHVETTGGDHVWVRAKPDSSISELRKTISVGLAVKPEHVILQKGKEFLEDRDVMGMSSVHGKSLHAIVTAVPLLATGSGGNLARIWSVPHSREEARFQHEGNVNSVAWSPDGSRLATGSDDGHVRVFEVESCCQEHCFEVHFRVLEVAWNPAGTKIAASSDDFCARVFDYSTGGTEVNVRHPMSVLCVHWHPSGTRIATGCGDDFARIVETATGTEQVKLKHDSDVNAVAFSPDGKLLLTGSADGHVRIFELTNSAFETRFTIGSPVSCLAWCPRSARFAVGARDGATRILDAGAKCELGRFAHSGHVNAVAWNRPGTKIATGSSDGNACIYDVAAFAEESRIDHGRFVYSVAWSP